MPTACGVEVGECFILISPLSTTAIQTVISRYLVVAVTVVVTGQLVIPSQALGADNDSITFGVVILEGVGVSQTLRAFTAV